MLGTIAVVLVVMWLLGMVTEAQRKADEWLTEQRVRHDDPHKV
jgi:hypothetical protein